MVVSMLMSMSAVSWVVFWISMEISSFFFVPILISKWSISKVSVGLSYFLFQSVGSIFFLFFIWQIQIGESEVYESLLTLSMLFKLGVFPFHGWMFRFCENLPWLDFLLLVSIQEINPLIVLTKLDGSVSSICFCVVSVMLVPMFSSMNLSIRWMMMVSSLFNVNWMILASFSSKKVLIFFFFAYFSLLWAIFFYLSMKNYLCMSSMYSGSLKFSEKMVNLFVVSLMMGLPPFGVFLGKVEILISLFEVKAVFLGGLFLVISASLMFMYSKMLFTIISGGTESEKKKEMYYDLIMVFFYINILSFLPWMISF